MLAATGILGGGAGASLLATGSAGAAGASPKPPDCNAQAAPSYKPDPVLGAAADQYFGDAEMATIASTANTIGIPTPTSTTGSPSNPFKATHFAAAYLDETELYEYVNDSTTGANPSGSPGAYDATQPVLKSLPTGTVKHLTGGTSTGPGMPYAAVLSADLKHVLGSVPVTVTSESYTVDPTAWMPGAHRQPPSSCAGPHYAAMRFNAGALSGLKAGTTYAAYLLVRDTDVSGPLANHIWYFTPQPAPLKAYAGYADSYRTGPSTPSPWQGSANVIFKGCNYYSPDRCTKTSTGADRYDAGAIRLVNTNSQAVQVSKASITIGSCTFKAWPGLNVSVPGGKELILTQTGGKPTCHTTGAPFNLDTSETSHSCTKNDGLIPLLHVTVDGVALTYRDNLQILNTDGVDPGAKRCGLRNETHDWGPMTGP